MQWEYLKYDDLRQQVPVFQYKRFQFDQIGRYKYIFHPQLQYGYGFLLREIIYKAAYGEFENGGTGLRQNFFIEIVKTLNSVELQNVPTPLDLIGSPGHDTGTLNMYVPSPAPYDNTGFNLSMRALPQVKNKIILNVFYSYREVVEMLISYDTTFITPPQKTYLDLILIGYLIPEKSLALWR